MTKHTPGPWHYIVDPEGKFGIYPEGGKFLAITNHEANARLIAAAPRMYDELLKCAERFRFAAKRDPNQAGLWETAAREAEEAAKAEGTT